MKQKRVRLILDLFVPDEQTIQACESLDSLVDWGLNRGALGLLDLHSHTHRIEFEPANSIDVLLDLCRERWSRRVALRYDEREGVWRIEDDTRHILASDDTIAGLRAQLIELLAKPEAPTP